MSDEKVNLKYIEWLLEEFRRRVLACGAWFDEHKQRNLQRLDAIRTRLQDPIRLSFVGDFSVGKTSIINSLLGRDVAPTGIEPTTAIITYFLWGAKDRVRIHFRNGEEQDASLSYFSHLVKHSNHSADDRDLVKSVEFVEVFVPCDVLHDITIVDTPGLGSLNEPDDKVTEAHLRDADAICWVFDAEKPGVRDELQRIRNLSQLFRSAFAVVNRCDSKPPAERPKLRRRILKECDNIFEDVILYSAHVVLNLAKGESIELEDREHLCLDLTEEISTRVRPAADQLRVDVARDGAAALAKDNAAAMVRQGRLLDEAFTILHEEIPAVARSVRENWPRRWTPFFGPPAGNF